MFSKVTAMPMVAVNQDIKTYKELRGSAEFHFNTKGLSEVEFARCLGFDLIERKINYKDMCKVPTVFLQERCLGKIIVVNNQNHSYSWNSNIHNKADLLARIESLFTQDVLPFRDYSFASYSDKVLRESKDQLVKLFDGYVYHLFNKVYVGEAGQVNIDRDQYTIQMQVEILFLREWLEVQSVVHDMYQAENRTNKRQQEDNWVLRSAWKNPLCQLVFITPILDGLAQGINIEQKNILSAALIER